MDRRLLLISSGIFLFVVFGFVLTQNSGITGHSITGKTVKDGNPIVVLETSKGDIKIELYPEKSPLTVENFLMYVNEGHYEGTVFHRVIKGFMIQGGGFTKEGSQKQTKAPIKLESDNGLKNEIGTIAMARTMVPDSATSQFFINTADNDFLNYGARNDGYAVFGRVIQGMDTVLEIENSKTAVKHNMQDWPVEDIVIISARVSE
jgi:cyclophilin family peptidyl-prolyl cis-trans isomerase